MLLRLAADPDFTHWLREQEAEEAGRLIDLQDAVQLYRTQGRAQIVQSLLRDIDRAKERTHDTLHRPHLSFPPGAR